MRSQNCGIAWYSEDGDDLWKNVVFWFFKNWSIFFPGESVSPSEDRGGLEFDAGETGDDIQADEGDEGAMKNDEDHDQDCDEDQY